MPNAQHVLLVDSDAVLSASLVEQLAPAGPYAIAAVGTLAEARAALAGEPPVFVIVDQQLPDGDGEDFARELRADGFVAPILLLADGSGVTAASERIAKPFRFSVLLSRIHALLSRQSGHDETPLRIGPYLFRPGAKLLTDANARKIRLTEKETNILKFLAAAGRTVPRETLLHEVWGYNPAVTTHTLETHIYRLRRKIEENPGQAQILVTEGGGYRLGGPDGHPPFV